MKVEIKDILLQVEKPARYLGNEINVIKKDISKDLVRFAFCFPDVYEVGMSFLGLQILYSLLNSKENVWCERVFAPWVDMEEKMREKNIPLFGLESRESIRNFDFVAFTLQYELSYNNILNMLDLSGIPIWQKDRKENDPFVLVGGPCAYNMEPIADFVDIVCLGEGEEMMLELMDEYDKFKEKNLPREEFLKMAAKNVKGVYIPKFHDVLYNEDGTIKSITPNIEGIEEKIQKRIVEDMNTAHYPKEVIVPFIDVVHDRVMVEIFRGCTRGCRFCQAGMVYRPNREKSVETICNTIKNLSESTGHDEISITSLSTSDYSGLHELTDHILKEYQEKKKISMSLPSLRLDNFSMELANKVQKVKKSGLTFAPEAGSQRLRDVINKGITEEDLNNATKKAFEMGWQNIKLYFMIGLPTEQESDLHGIVDLAFSVMDNYREIKQRVDRYFNVTISTSCFVPKPFTPFQWFGQNKFAEFEEKEKYLSKKLRHKGITYRYHDARTSFLEAILARGDRRLSNVIFEAFKRGCKFDGWIEHFKFDTWMQVFEDLNVDTSFYANRERSYDEIFPWDHIDVGVSKEFLIRENEKAKREELTNDCRKGCSACGVHLNLGKGIC